MSAECCKGEIALDSMSRHRGVFAAVAQRQSSRCCNEFPRCLKGVTSKKRMSEILNECHIFSQSSCYITGHWDGDQDHNGLPRLIWVALLFMGFESLPGCVKNRSERCDCDHCFGEPGVME